MLASKEAHAASVKRRLGITAWREFSEDMTQGLKHIQVWQRVLNIKNLTSSAPRPLTSLFLCFQDSAAYKKTGEALNVAREKTASMWGAVTASSSFQKASTSVGSVFGAAKTKISSSLSSQNVAADAAAKGDAKAEPAAEAIPEAANGKEADKKEEAK